MNKIELFAIICCSSLMFVVCIDEDISVLLARGESLATRAHKTLDPLNENYNFSRGRLIYPANYELKRLELCVSELHNSSNSQRTPEMDDIEEEMLYRENKLEHELGLIEDIWTNFNSSLASNELEQYAHKLTQQATGEMERLGHEDSHTKDLTNGLNEIEYLLQRIANTTEHSPDNFDQNDIDLVEQFRSIRDVFEQIRP